VWLATYKPSKRPEWFTRLAQRHPEFECVMAGVLPAPPSTDADYRAALAVGDRCPNLSVGGPVPHERIGEFLLDATLFVHTSAAEGFPNAFLEAWSYGLPTITCFDPDGIIARERLGEQHDTFEAWEDAVVRWMSDPAGRAAAGARARAYAKRAHDSGEIEDRFAAELDRLVALRRTHRGRARLRDHGASR
jgi:glycosyltransferase involved in cell wall biosynthesis